MTDFGMKNEMGDTEFFGGAEFEEMGDLFDAFARDEAHRVELGLPRDEIDLMSFEFQPLTQKLVELNFRSRFEIAVAH